MYSIDILMEEHQNILKFTEVLRRICGSIIEGGEVPDKDLRDGILFIRNYSDAHHHGKEEEILFADMTRELGRIGENLIRHGMMVEHDLARLHVTELEQALDRYAKAPTKEDKVEIIGHAMSYANLLKRHTEKEDAVVYTYAAKHLSFETMNRADERTKLFEEAATANNTREPYLEILNRLDSTY